MGGTCSTYGRWDMHTGFWWGKQWKRPHGIPSRRWEDNIKMYLQWDRMPGTVFVSLRAGISGRLSWYPQWTFGFGKMWVIFWLAKKFLVSQEDCALLSKVLCGLFDAVKFPQHVGSTVRPTISLFRQHPRPTDGGVMTSEAAGTPYQTTTLDSCVWKGRKTKQKVRRQMTRGFRRSGWREPEKEFRILIILGGGGGGGIIGTLYFC
jgi:hypothetical protein